MKLARYSIFAALVLASCAIPEVPDNEVGFQVTAAPSLKTTEAGGTATFTILSNVKPTVLTTVSIVSSNPKEGVPTPSTLTFTPEDWSEAQTVTITGQDDQIDDGSVEYTISFAVDGDSRFKDFLPAPIKVVNEDDDDKAGITVVPSATPLVTTEAGGTATFTVVLTSEPVEPVKIPIKSSNELEAKPSTDSLTFTPSNWSELQTVTVTGVNDDVAEGDQTFEVRIGPAETTDGKYKGQSGQTLAGTNTDDDVAAVVVVAPPRLLTSESDGRNNRSPSATFTVSLQSRPTSAVAITISSSDETEGRVLPTGLRFTPENWSEGQTVGVTGVDDSDRDGLMNYNIILAAAVSDDPSYQDKFRTSISAQNQDDDTPGFDVVPLSLPLVTNEEGSLTARFQVALTTRPSHDVTLSLSSTKPREGQPSPASLTFTRSDWNVAQFVSVQGVQDDIDDDSQSYQITGEPTSTDSDYDGATHAMPPVDLTNTDDDTAGISVSLAALPRINEGATTTFTIVLNSRPTSAVDIQLSSDSTICAPSPSSVHFEPGEWNVSHVVTITGVHDYIVYGPSGRPCLVQTEAASSSDPKYNRMESADVSVTIGDIDTAAVQLSRTSGLTTTEAGGTATFTVQLTSRPQMAGVTINLASDDPTEGAVVGSPLFFEPNETSWNTPQTVTVQGVNDDVDDDNVTYHVTASVVSADPAYSNQPSQTVTVTNQDNDTAAILVGSASRASISETPGSGALSTFTVSLQTQPIADVVINLSSSDTTECSVSPGSVRLTSSNWNQPIPVTITAVDDFVADGTQSCTISTAPANAVGDSKYNNMNAADVSVSVTDDDVVGVVVSPVVGLVTTESGGTGTFTMALRSQPLFDVAFSLASSDLSEGTVAPALVTFTAANWNIAQTITVTGVNDALFDGDILYSITTLPGVSTDSNYSGLNPPDVTVTNADDDANPFPYAPSNIIMPGVSVNNTNVTVSGNCTLDTTVGAMLPGCLTGVTLTTQSQMGGPDVEVLSVHDLTVSSGATLNVRGPRPLIVLAQGDVTIDGTIDASASAGGTYSNPGAGGNGTACLAGVGPGAGAGGGGGGLGTAGGGGGNSAAAGTGGGGGAASSNTTLVPLIGGCAGSAGQGTNAGVGGAGGGGIQISAAGTLLVTASGRIRAAGYGGQGANANARGGGGGGSGGGISLEGATLTLTAGAAITANGGGGGEGGAAGGSASPVDGAIGTLDGVTVAAGGAGNTSSGGDGGAGGAGTINATAGLVGTSSTGGGGGGGGGMGRILLRAYGTCTRTGVTFSPATTSTAFGQTGCP